MGYNPYRKANGEFATKEEAGAQVKSDYEAALSSGDSDRINEIEEYVVNNMDNTPLGQEVLKRRYGSISKVSKITPSEAADIIVSNSAKAFSYYRGGDLENKEKTLKTLRESRERLSSFVSSYTEEALKSQMGAQELRESLASVKSYGKALKIADDAIAILDENSLVKPSKDINLDSYDENGNRGDYSSKNQ